MSEAVPAPLARPDTTAMREKPSLWRFGCIGLASLAVVLLFTSLGLLIWGLIIGKEFNPATFQTRSFWYFRLPVVNLPLGERWVEDTTSGLYLSLVADHWISAAADTGQWDLVADNWPRSNSHDFDAAILDTCLGEVDRDGILVWSSWNDRHPLAAKDLWPAIADLARSGNYVLVPDVLRLAREYAPQKDDPGRFADQLKLLMGRLLLDRSRLETDCGRREQARAAAKLAFQYDPSDEARLLVNSLAK